MEPPKIRELANLLRNNGDKILNSESTFTLTGSLLHALNRSFRDIAAPVEIRNADAFEVLKPMNSMSPDFRDLQLVYDFVQKTTLLCIVHYPSDEYFTGTIDIRAFRALKRLEVQKTNIEQIVGIKALRSQLQHLICVKSLHTVNEVITHCGGDRSNGFVWNELKVADFSYNNLQTVDTSLEFAQFLQHLNLRHNQLVSVEAIKWLPHLKTLDLSFNKLLCVPQFHLEACKRLQSLNMSNNFVEDLIGVAKLDALTDFDLADNCLLDHTYLMPLSALMTLKYLNLYGNPLYCHPKHRLATAQFLHKNTATVKFILDFEPLSKSEKAVTGTHQLRHTNSVNRISKRTTSTSSIISKRRTDSVSQTPNSSVGSLMSFVLPSGSETEAETATTAQPDVANGRRARTVKNRTVEIDEIDPIHESTTTSLAILPEACSEHLEAKQQVETLREKYGADWLQSGNAEMMQSILGGESLCDDLISQSRARQTLEDYLGEFSANASSSSNGTTAAPDLTVRTSTPTDDSRQQLLQDSQQRLESTVSPIKASDGTDNHKESTQYMSIDASSGQEQTVYISARAEPAEATTSEQADDKEETEEIDPDLIETHLSQPETASEPEDDEEMFVVHTENCSDAICLTLSSNFLRERDPITQHTQTKWSLKILEACERIRADTLCIHFDTVKADKQQRIYIAKGGECQELERQLRHILSSRDLHEMNQSPYRCAKCECQFVVERNKYQLTQHDVRCPTCSSAFVLEYVPPISLTQLPPMPKLSPASVAEEMLPQQKVVGRHSSERDETASIGSANSLNESSSCSKITNSQSSFDSNQSVAGSSNTDRDNFQASGAESDVDILSNPSQSSIEVLDGGQPYGQQQRKVSSEERQRSASGDGGQRGDAPAGVAQTPISPLAHFNLTESSSSGSVTDSVCTAYEQAEKTLLSVAGAGGTPTKSTSDARNANSSFLDAERYEVNEREVDGASIASMFDVIFKSTNLLMKSSKKIGDGNALPPDAAAVDCVPYKFNYKDFNEVDHRLKLYFYQSKFEDNEHFKWVVRCRLYNENTHTLCDGVVVMSTCKLYLMTAQAAEHNNVSQWLRPLVSVSVDRLECVELLPWKIGLRFTLRNWGSVLLLLQDILRTDSLLLYFANNPLPAQCTLQYQPDQRIQQRLSAAVGSEQLKMCSLLNGCVVSCENAKRTLEHCALLTTDTHLYLSSSNLAWLALDASADVERDLQISVTQLMSNLVEAELVEGSMTIKFHDELQNKMELWRCTFETTENAASCHNAISQSWEKIFSVPL